jgi:hypothetical protein
MEFLISLLDQVIARRKAHGPVINQSGATYFHAFI